MYREEGRKLSLKFFPLRASIGFVISMKYSRKNVDFSTALRCEAHLDESTSPLSVETLKTAKISQTDKSNQKIRVPVKTRWIQSFPPIHILWQQKKVRHTFSVNVKKLSLENQINCVEFPKLKRGEESANQATNFNNLLPEGDFDLRFTL